MRLYAYCSLAGAVVLLAATPGQAQTNSTRTSSLPSSQKTDPTRRGTAAHGVLPDPVLLDGSAQPPEKKPEYGMLGEFELPGDDNAKGDRVGGQSQPQGSPSGGGQQASAQGGGGAADGSQPAGAQGGGGAAGGPQQASTQGGGAAGGGAQAANGQQGAQGGAAGGASAVQNDPNAKAEGMQVAGLSGDGDTSGQGGAGGGDVQKPQQVALGDPTMRIKPAANAPGAVGGVTAGSTQQMEGRVSNVGGGGSRDGRNSSEKGRVMPAGL